MLWLPSCLCILLRPHNPLKLAAELWKGPAFVSILELFALTCAGVYLLLLRHQAVRAAGDAAGAAAA